MILALIAIAIVPPGALNPAVTQDTINQTICVRGWTGTVRPPMGYTSALKRKQMRAAHLSGSPRNYEEDHFIPLELGGAPSDPNNLWPEPMTGIGGAKAKDRLENHLRSEVCAGRLTLDAAQKAITIDWRNATIAHRR